MTYEEVKRIRENPTAEDVDCKEPQKLIDEAIEKQIPKKPIAIETDFYDNSYECPVCGLDMGPCEFKYCNNCGQKLKWGEEDDQRTVNPEDG